VQPATSALVRVIALTVLSHAGFVGARVTVSLSALQQGGSALTVGVLMALFAVVPMLLAVHAGRFMDRTGVLRPLAWSSVLVVAGILVPFALPGLAPLYAASVVIGTAFMLQHLVLNHMVGSIGDPAERPVHFSWLALGYATSGTIGPLLAGFAIDLVSYRAAFLLLALPPAAGVVLLWWRPPPLPPVHAVAADAAPSSVRDLMGDPRLRGVFVYSGLIAAGWDLYTVAIPVYGSQVGLSASTIGVVMSSFALATFVVRLFMPHVARRLREWTVICTALVVSAFAYAVLPFVAQVPLLIAFSFLLGLGLGCSQPLIMSLLYTASPPGRQGEVVGMRTTLLNASHTFLPLLFGAVGAAVGVGPVFWAMSGLLLSGGWFAGRRMRAG
jgi:MFS family permease